jgi:hypothetical protein
MIAAAVGAVIGDNIGYWIGRRFGRGFLERHGHRIFISRERLEKADAFYRKHGGKTVFLARFVPVARSVGIILAGVSEMPWKRFFLYDIAGAVLWAIGNATLGYLAGASYPTWERYANQIVLGIIVVVGLALGAQSSSPGAEVRRQRPRGPDRARPRAPGRFRRFGGTAGMHATDYLRHAVEMGASDLHLKVGNVPFIRVDGALQPTEFPEMEPEDTVSVANELMPEHRQKEFAATNEADFGYTLPGVGRFRINVFRQRGAVGLAIRRVRSEVPSFEELLLPPVMARLAESSRA